ncbi:GPP34 family phosphoprotein [Amycolatopsis sp. NPDC021455]|uniref:GPP34 family phosphoprotein n=1 Tax=Amycolatopsis sp. NPDC021455 TaxID=3154901 RepID=UPI0033F5C820
MPAYRASLQRAGPASPADTLVIGDGTTVTDAVKRYEDAGVTDLIVVPLNERSRTLDLLLPGGRAPCATIPNPHPEALFEKSGRHLPHRAKQEDTMDHSHDLGPMPAALLLLTHDDSKGRARLGAELLSCGLLTTQLAELVLSGRLVVQRDRTGSRMQLRREEEHARTTTTETALERLVVDQLNQLAQTANPTVKLLYRTSGTQAYEVALRQLVTDGIMTASTVRTILGRRQQVFRTASAWHANKPLALITKTLEDPSQAAIGAGFIICLLDELGSPDLLRGQGISGARLARVANSLRPAFPAPLESLLQQLREAVNSIVNRVRL